MSVVCPECGYNAGDKRILDLHLSVTGHSLNPGPKPEPSGYFGCSVHTDLPPMTALEFDNHKTTHDMENTTERTRNTQQLGTFGLVKNMGIEPCERVPIPVGDPRLKMVQPSPDQVVVKEIIREVLVRCPYCRGLTPEGSLKCSTCGASL